MTSLSIAIQTSSFRSRNVSRMSIHNTRFLIKIMEGAREAIKEDRFEEYMTATLAAFGDKRGF